MQLATYVQSLALIVSAVCTLGPLCSAILKTLAFVIKKSVVIAMWSCWWVAVEGRLSSVASQDPPLVHEARCFRAAVHRMNCPVSIQFTVNRRLPEEGEAASQPHGFKTLFLASDMPTVVSPVSASGTCR